MSHLSAEQDRASGFTDLYMSTLDDRDPGMFQNLPGEENLGQWLALGLPAPHGLSSWHGRCIAIPVCEWRRMY